MTARACRWALLYLLGLPFQAACQEPASSTWPADAAAPLVLTLRPDLERQEIHHFGASDAWSIQFVGEEWPEATRERVADLLFSLGERPDGSPAGIGLSAWRFNIGGGSMAQGGESGIRDEWRRADAFLTPAGDPDWSRHAGQRWFLRAARERGVGYFVGFVNSPPLVWTRNGRAHSSGGESSNLRPDRYGEYARYLRDVVVRLEAEDGVRLDQVSPVNEPQWDWLGGQEGSPWLNRELRDVVAEISVAFHEAGLATRIGIPEAARLEYLLGDFDRPGRGDQAAAFFDPASPLYVGDLPNVDHEVSGHSYFTTWNPEAMVAVRERVRDRLRAIDPALRFAMSEYCVLEDNPEIRGPGRDLGMATALYVARVMHADLAVADATAWHWWLAVSPYDYKDGLVYIDRSRTGGEVHESKLLWAVGHFSRFVRPAMRRIEVDRSDGLSAAASIRGLLASAYRDPATGATTIVVVNQESRDRAIRVRGDDVSAFRVYLTSPDSGDDLRFLGQRDAAEDLVVPARSLVTLVAP
jgi:O-glycosyl hydrolase